MKQAEKLRQIGLGVQLRKARQEAGMTTRSVAMHLGMSPSSVDRNELGSRIPKRDEVSALCALYGVTGDDKEALLERVSQPADSAAWLASGYVPDQLARLMVLEQEATTITHVAVALIPGLAQTAQYARLTLGPPTGDDTDLERLVTTRIGRQSLISRPRAPKVGVSAHRRGSVVPDFREPPNDAGPAVPTDPAPASGEREHPCDPLRCC